MISKQQIKELEFENINGVFDYVLESIINGQLEQAHSLINQMSNRQVNWFEIYLTDCPFHDSYIEKAQEILKETK